MLGAMSPDGIPMVLYHYTCPAVLAPHCYLSDSALFRKSPTSSWPFNRQDAKNAQSAKRMAHGEKRQGLGAGRSWQCALRHALCPMRYVPCSMRYALCKGGLVKTLHTADIYYSGFFDR
jgi:hypothetical protein